jgi:hypothetical protein
VTLVWGEPFAVVREISGSPDGDGAKRPSVLSVSGRRMRLGLGSIPPARSPEGEYLRCVLTDGRCLDAGARPKNARA